MQLCAALFPHGSEIDDGWTYSAARLVMIAGTNVLAMGSKESTLLATIITQLIARLRARSRRAKILGQTRKSRC